MGEPNQNILDTPSWMNRHFFEEVFKKYENNETVSITEIKIAPATENDHYSSIMFRATIGYDTAESKRNLKSLIIKTMPELEGQKKDMFQESFIFETEIAMYSKTIPRFETELRKIGDDTIFGAKALYFSLKPRKCIIFEDIRVQSGYETIQNRLANMEEAKATLLKLAKWHAVSYKLGVEGDLTVTGYNETLFKANKVEGLPFMTSGIQNLIDKLETIDELKSIIPKLRSIQKNLLSRCIGSFQAYNEKTAKGIFVLCHGDFHCKNVMFKRNDKGELEDVKLIDFQQCYYGPAVLDVLNGLYMLVNEDLRTNHRDELIYYYSTNFVATLEKMQFQGEYPSVSDFFIEILRHRHWELFLLATFLPVCYAFFVESGNLGEMLTSDDARRNTYDHPDFIKELKRILPVMLHRGYLD